MSGAASSASTRTSEASSSDPAAAEPPSIDTPSASRELDTEPVPQPSSYATPPALSSAASEESAETRLSSNATPCHVPISATSTRPKLHALDGGLLTSAARQEAPDLDAWAPQGNPAAPLVASGELRAVNTLDEGSEGAEVPVKAVVEDDTKPAAIAADASTGLRAGQTEAGSVEADDAQGDPQVARQQDPQGGAPEARQHAGQNDPQTSTARESLSDKRPPQSVSVQLWRLARAGLRTAGEALARLPRPELRWHRNEAPPLIGNGSEDKEVKQSAGAAAVADAAELLLLDNIRALRTARVEDVRVPRADIAFISHDMNLDEIIAKARSAGHSRFPVMGESQDEVLGMIHIKDLLWGDLDSQAFRVRDFLREVLFVAPSMPVLQLLQDMQLKRHHMALIVDEFGGIDGLVTIEDLVEEIVGDISDEHDADREPALLAQADGTWIIDARYRIDELEELIGPFLTDDEREEYLDTLGGLVTHIAGRVPSRNELIEHDSGLRFLVVEADPRRIKRLRMRAKSLAAAKGLVNQTRKQSSDE